jgi:hypothetical protein
MLDEATSYRIVELSRMRGKLFLGIAHGEPRLNAIDRGESV